MQSCFVSTDSLEDELNTQLSRQIVPKLIDLRAAHPQDHPHIVKKNVSTAAASYQKSERREIDAIGEGDEQRRILHSNVKLALIKCKLVECIARNWLKGLLLCCGLHRLVPEK